MKWFQHLTDSLDDDFIFDLMTRFGASGYLVYFGTIEVLARNFEPGSGNEVRTTWVQLGNKLRMKPKSIRKILDHFVENKKMTFKENDGYLYVNFPILQQLLDEYAKKKIRQNVRTNSGQTPDSVRTPMGGEIEEEGEEDKEKKNTLADPLSQGDQPKEPATPLFPEEPPVFVLPQLPVSKSGKTAADHFDVTQAQMDEWAVTFPALNILSELRRMKVWLDANPTKRKSNVKRFVSNWLTKAQDRAGRGNPQEKVELPDWKKAF